MHTLFCYDSLVQALPCPSVIIIAMANSLRPLPLTLFFRKLRRRNISALFAVVTVPLVVLLSFSVVALWENNQALQTQITSLQLLTGQQRGNPDAAQAADSPPSVTSPGEKVTPVQTDDHIRGSRDARVILIEYSDIDCPYCKIAHETMQQLVDDYGGTVAWVFRDYPLTSIHPNALAKAEAAECVAGTAGEDAYWKYLQLLFDRGSAVVRRDQLADAANELGVSREPFLNCLESGQAVPKVQRDLESGKKVGVRGTPGTVILRSDGTQKFVSGALPYAKFKESIDAVLSQ
jgi:protein-disulfide isomerase